jgi:glycosyltransferase involved in cell wall biosynthesis
MPPSRPTPPNSPISPTLEACPAHMKSDSSSKRRRNTSSSVPPSTPRTAPSTPPSPFPGPSSGESSPSPSCRISFIIPSLGRHSLHQLITQLKLESQPGDEILLIADGPSPETALYKTDPQVRYFEYHDPSKGNKQRDFGITQATGDFLTFIDDDDLFIPGALANIVRPELAKDPHNAHIFRIVGIIGSRRDWIYSGAANFTPNQPEKLDSWYFEEPCACQSTSCEHHFTHSIVRNFPNFHLHNRAIYLMRPFTAFMWQYLIRFFKMGSQYAWQCMALINQGEYDEVNNIIDSRITAIHDYSGFYTGDLVGR